MATGSLRREVPASREALAHVLGGGAPVRFTGGGTKLAWGDEAGPVDVELSTSGLDRIVEHNAGDLTAVLEAGVPLERAQKRFAGEGQMLALDPPDGGATIGGVLATADSGPLRTRYGGPRDLVVGMTVALADGSVAKAGGKVIKNVAGYDLAKLFTGSFGTLGAIVEVAVRLHPLPERTATAAGGTSDAETLARAGTELSHAPLEAQSLDVRWGGGDGALLARFGGAEADAQAASAAERLRDAGMNVTVTGDDYAIWELQRNGQRSRDGTVVRVSGLQSELPKLLSAADRLGARLVGRAGMGLSWVKLEDRSPEDMAAGAERLRQELSPAPCSVLDAPPEVRERLEPWPALDPGAAELMRRVKERFDPDGACNPGVLP
jgi:glycolate oxidase FAD binding subunit